jgi:hypothetical protein
VPIPSTDFGLIPSLPVAGLLFAALLVTGCDKKEDISTYTVPKHASLQTPEFLAASEKRKPLPERMLAAIIPNGPSMWFFKLQGPPDAVANREVEFREFLKSVRFPNPDKVEWTLPKDWRERPGNEMRYATLVLNGEPPLEVSVTTLPGGMGDLTEALLANINRWRGQLDLPFIQAEDLPSRSESIPHGEHVITLVNFVGKAKPKPAMAGGMMPPMHGAGGEDAKPARPQPPTNTAEPSEVTYDKPDEWSVAPPKPFSMATFEARDGEKAVTITISRAGGDRAANVNRWRGQLGLNPLPADEVGKSVSKIEIGARIGELVEITGNDRTLLGVMLPDGEQTVFIKLMGDASLAASERARFEAFAKSVRF